MKATLHPNGNIALTSRGETRVFAPSHDQYAKISALYVRHAAVALSCARPPDDSEYAIPEGYGGFPWAGGVPDYSETYDIPLEHLHVDPDRFQLPSGHNAAEVDVRSRRSQARENAEGIKEEEFRCMINWKLRYHTDRQPKLKPKPKSTASFAPSVQTLVTTAKLAST